MFEAREEVLEEIKWNGDDDAPEMKIGMWTFTGAKRKDFYCSDLDYEKILIPGTRIRSWTIQFSRVAGMEYWDKDKNDWVAFWYVDNNFETKAQKQASMDGYINFIQEEAEKIKTWIDEGKDLKFINKNISDEHTGNTIGCAIGWAIANATNKENAEKVNVMWNRRYGHEGSNGTVNPAIMTISS